MRGTFQQGDILLVKSTPLENLQVGDVIVFNQQESGKGMLLVAHRIYARTEMALVTRGDFLPSPDSVLVYAHNLIGRVHLVQRNGTTRRVVRGCTGRLWRAYLCCRRLVLELGRLPYRMLNTSGIVRRLWHPHVTRVYLSTDRGFLIKYVYKQKTVASWAPKENRFQCRKPFDLVLASPTWPE